MTLINKGWKLLLVAFAGILISFISNGSQIVVFNQDSIKDCPDLVFKTNLKSSDTIILSQQMPVFDGDSGKDKVMAAYKKLMYTDSIDPVQANFPFEAKRQILELTGNSNLGVIAGFFYRDVNNNGRYDPEEEFSATMLGQPETEGSTCRSYFNCYWFDPVSPGKSYRIRYEHDGVEPFVSEIKPKAGLNILHIPVTPVKPLVYIVPHSHFDSEWVMTYEQSLKLEIPHIKQRLDILQNNPVHCFYNDEECVTRPFVERAEQKYVDMLRQGIADGMIEPKGLITQGELTMPYGESIIRGITYGERMLSDLLGEKIRPKVFSSIDQYGYGYQLPQILKKAGRQYFLSGEYLSLDEDATRIPHSNPAVRKHSEFWLQGIDSSMILVYSEPYWKPDLIFGPHRLPVGSHKSVLNFFGGDFTAPNLKLTSYCDSLNNAKSSYKYIISSPTSFFHAIGLCPDIPTYTSECFVNYWSGVYESRAEGRIRNRNLENRILASESLATMAGLKGMSYPKGAMDEAWYWLLINQDHDPQMSPMGVPGLYEGSVLPRYETTEAYINAALTETLNWLATEITADQQPGEPVIVFNPLASQRSVIIQTQVYSRLPSVSVTDLHGNPVLSQIINKSGLGTTICFLAENLPSLGWKTYYINEKTDLPVKSSTAVTTTENLLENEYLRIELKNGIIQKIVEKGSGTVIFKAESSAGINEVFIWKDEGCISIVKPTDKKDVADFIDNPDAELVARSSEVKDRKVTVLETGPARGVIQSEYSLDWGRFLQKISLDAGSRIIRFTTNVHWNSTDRISNLNGRRVRVAFNSAYKNARVLCDIPFGVIGWEQSEIIRPVNSWLGIENGTTGAAFFHHGPQSVQVVNDIAYMTLFRSVLEPPKEEAKCNWDNPLDKATEDGDHIFNYEVYLHRGDWKTANVPDAAAGENMPVFIKLPDRLVKDKLLPGEESFISVKPASLVVTAVKPTEYSKSGIIVRLYNPTDIPINGKLVVGFPCKGFGEVNFREEPIRPLKPEGNELTLHIAPYEIFTVQIVP